VLEIVSVYGWLFLPQPNDQGDLHLAIECVRQGFATPKAVKYPSKQDENKADNEDVPSTDIEDYESKLSEAYQEAERGIHETKNPPLLRNVKNAVDDFATLALVDNACKKTADQGRITCVIEYIFDGSRLRCQITDPTLPQYQYASYTLLLAGITAPRGLGNPKALLPMAAEEFAEDARQFVHLRLRSKKK